MSGVQARRFGLFDGFKKKLDDLAAQQDEEELKKSVEDLKKAKVGDKTLEEASQELNEKMNEKVGEGTAKVRSASKSRTSSSSGGITQHASV